MQSPDYQYLYFMGKLYRRGDKRPDRTGTGTSTIFGHQMRFDLADGFPILSTKRVHFPSVAKELLWFLRGSTNAKELEDEGCNIWREWGDPVTRELGPVYGKQWRAWEHIAEVDPYGHPSYEHSQIDQVANVLKSLKDNPFDRGHIINTWNAGDLDRMALRPCHVMYQFDVSSDFKLSCHMYQRSADWFLGVPFNIASTALLTHIFARELGYGLGEVIISYGNAHLYSNHREAAMLQMGRAPYPMPELFFDDGAPAWDKLNWADLHLEGYEHHPAIPAPVAV